MPPGLPNTILGSSWWHGKRPAAGKGKILAPTRKRPRRRIGGPRVPAAMWSCQGTLANRQAGGHEVLIGEPGRPLEHVLHQSAGQGGLSGSGVVERLLLEIALEVACSSRRVALGGVAF